MAALKAKAIKSLRKEYQVWRLSAPFLYELVSVHALEWPSLTVQWLPGMRQLTACDSDEGDRDYTVLHCCVGTNTCGHEQNTLRVLEVLIPPQARYDELSERTLVDERDGSTIVDWPMTAGTPARVSTIIQYRHADEVHRVRHVPQIDFSHIVATRSAQRAVNIFDLSIGIDDPTRIVSHTRDHATTDMCDDVVLVNTEHSACISGEQNNDKALLMELEGPQKRGWAVEWNRNKLGLLASGSDDGSIHCWDLAQQLNHQSQLSPDRAAPLCSFCHGEGVDDVDWQHGSEHVLAAVGGDKNLSIWDTRSSSTRKPSQRVMAHEAEVSSVEWSGFECNTLATGSSDQRVFVWDVRELRAPLYKLAGHTDQVYSVKWSPTQQGVLASSACDRRVYVWDLNRIGSSQTQEEIRDGPPELLFIHGGHTSQVMDVDWHPQVEWLLASVAEDNLLHVWQMSDAVRAN